MDANQSIKDKIRKLLAVGSADSGATEDEQDTAMRMASILMARHGIEANALGSEAPRARFGEKRKERFLPYKVYTAQAAGVLYGCKILCSEKGIKGITFVGRPDNIDATEETFAWLLVQIENLYKAGKPSGLSGYAGQKWVESFRYACALRVLARANEAVAAIATEKPSSANALVVGDYFKQLEAENDATMRREIPNLKVVRIGGTNGAGTGAGYKAGDMVKLRREVGPSNTRRIAN